MLRETRNWTQTATLTSRACGVLPATSSRSLAASQPVHPHPASSGPACSALHIQAYLTRCALIILPAAGVCTALGCGHLTSVLRADRGVTVLTSHPACSAAILPADTEVVVVAPDMREPSFDAKAANVLRRDIRVTISECAISWSLPVERFPLVPAGAGAALYWQGHCTARLLHAVIATAVVTYLQLIKEEQFSPTTCIRQCLCQRWR